MRYKNLYLLGTSHISKQSILEIKAYLEREKPEIVALELDKKRFYSLLHNQKPSLNPVEIIRIGVKGYLFLLIGHYVQQKLGSIVKMKPGSDMLEAIKIARKNKLEIQLIDQDIEITLKKISERFTWKEKKTFFLDIIKAIFFKRQIKFDLRKVPEKHIITKLIKELKQKYPSLYETLIKERNDIMAKNLFKLIRKNPFKKTFCVVGAGHEEEIMKKVKELYSSNISFYPD